VSSKIQETQEVDSAVATLHWLPNEGLQSIDGEVAESIQDDIWDWLEAAHVPAKYFAIVNPIFSIDEENRDEHPLFLALSRVLRSDRRYVAAWLDGDAIHAVISGVDAEILPSLVAETLEKISKGVLPFDSKINPRQSSQVERSSLENLTDMFRAQVSLEQVLQCISPEDLAKVSFEQRQKLRQTLDTADSLDAQDLLGLKPGQRMTRNRMNKFLSKNSEKEMSDEMRQRVANLVRSFRNSSGDKLYILQESGDVECVLSIRFNNHIGHQQFRLRPVGGGSSIAERVRLPLLQFRPE